MQTDIGEHVFCLLACRLTFVFVTAHSSLQWQKALREQALEHSIVLSLEQEKEKAEKELRDAEEQEITLHCSVTELQVLGDIQPTHKPCTRSINHTDQQHRATPSPSLRGKRRR